VAFSRIREITAALCVVISHYLKADLQKLTPADCSASAPPTGEGRFRRFYEQTVMMPQVVWVKIYDAGMAVI
jgi:hypothetical protein